MGALLLPYHALAAWGARVSNLSPLLSRVLLAAGSDSQGSQALVSAFCHLELGEMCTVTIRIKKK